MTIGAARGRQLTATAAEGTKRDASARVAWILSAGLREVEVFWIANVIPAHAQDPSAPAASLVDEFVEGT